MKRELVLLGIWILVLPCVAMGGGGPDEEPEFVAKSVLIVSDGTQFNGPRPNEGIRNYGGNGFVGYSAAAETELKPTEELVQMMQRRQQQQSLGSSGRLSLDQESRAVVYRSGSVQMRLPLERTRKNIIPIPSENFTAVWSATSASPVPTDLLIALTEFYNNGARLLIFAVQRDKPDRWLVSSVPFTPMGPVKFERLRNEEPGLGLYSEGEQLSLFLPGTYGDQAWEIHLPATFEEPVRFNIFPVPLSQ